MAELVFGLLHPAPTTQQHKRLREFTIAWSRYGYHGPIIESDTLDSLLEQACALGHQYCFIQQSGHVIDEQWSPPHWNKESFHSALKRWIQQQDFFVTGQWQQSDHGCYGLKTDSLLINLDQYQALGKPAFGEASTQSQLLQQAMLERSADPLLSDKLNADDQQQITITDRSGWNFIDTSLRHNIPILAFPTVINAGRINLNDDQQSHNRLLDYIGKPLNGFSNDKSLNKQQKQFLLASAYKQNMLAKAYSCGTSSLIKIYKATTNAHHWMPYVLLRLVLKPIEF